MKRSKAEDKQNIKFQSEKRREGQEHSTLDPGIYEVSAENVG